MKFFRTSASLAIVAAFSVASALAAMAPRPPAAASAASSAPTGNACIQTVQKKLVFPLVMCVERANSTSANVGNGFPWENSTFFFASFRNQYLFPSASIAKVSATADSIESLHARAVSFSAGASHTYNNAGAGSFVRITGGNSPLNRTFSLNTDLSKSYASLTATAAAPIQIDMIAGPGGKQLSSCSSPTFCAGSPNPTSPASRDRWASLGLISTIPVGGNVMVDHKGNVGGGTGSAVWDTGFGTACEARRAYGSSTFFNLNHLTTAYGVDAFDFVWVFQGLAPPPAATVEQQIAEIIRLLLTPEGLRCSGLDLNGGNGKIEDTAISFPGGSSIDPISPQVSTNGIVTGDELEDAKRRAGFTAP